MSPNKNQSLGDWDFDHRRDGHDFAFDLICIRKGCPSQTLVTPLDSVAFEMTVTTDIQGPDRSVGFDSASITVEDYSPDWAWGYDAWKDIAEQRVPACLCGNFFPPTEALEAVLNKIADEVFEAHCEEAADRAADARFEGYNEQ